ncbi:MAG: hypothetical protein HC828_18895, partial [Blastochloris sp.]|nr:hypothetical protein [Blastochloris sp.]
TQFIQRLVAFVDQTGLTVQLAYYPPYHSKYNPIERCWAFWSNTGMGVCWTASRARLTSLRP